MSRPIKITAIVLAGLVVAIVILAMVWDWNWLKPVVETRLSASTGLNVRINGDLEGHMSWTPTFEAHDITIENPNWKGDEIDRKVGSITDFLISIDAKKLLAGHLMFPRIEITKPELNLRRETADEANWALPQKEDENKPAKRSSIPDIGELRITDGHLRYRDSVKKLDIKAKLSSVEGGNSDDRNSKIGFTLEGDGAIEKGPFQIKASGGPLLELSDSSKPYPLSIHITAGQTLLYLDGSITDPAKLGGVDAELKLQGATASDLFPLLNIPAPQTPPYTIKGRLVRKAAIWEFEKFAGTVGNSDLSGTLDVDTGEKPMAIKGTLESRRLDVKDVGPLIGIPPAAATKSTEQSAEQKRARDQYQADDRLLPDAKLNLGKVRSVNADVTWKAENINAPDLPLDNVLLHVVLKSGILDLDPLDLGVAGGKIRSRIRIDAREDVVKTDYDIHFGSFELGDFLKKGGFAGKGSGRIGGRIQLHAPGNSVRQSLGHASGTIGLVMNKGEISDLAVALIGLDIGEALKVVLTKDHLIPIRCVATSFDVNDGLMKPQVFVIDTDSTLIDGAGDINLRDEALHLKLIAEQKSPSMLAAPTPIDITGTLKHPGFGLDTTALVERGAAAVALGIVLTPLGSLLAFVDPGTADDADCLNLLKDVKQAPSAHPASRVKAPSGG